MSIKSMYNFKGVSQLNTFLTFLDKYNWRIEKQLLKDRVAHYNEFPMFIQMKKIFETKKISIWPLKEEEIITWFDTLTLLRRVSSELFHLGITLSEIHFFMEYPLVFGNYMRTDYLIVYDRLIIVLEFGMFNQDEKRSEERYTKKLQESISHRQLLANMIDSNVEVVNYVLIYKPEYDRILKTELDVNQEYNKNEIRQLSRFIAKKVRLQQDYSAISQLEKINP